MNLSHWEYFKEPAQGELEGLNEPISEDELWDNNENVKNRRAPGIDGIPSEFLKACVAERPRLFSVE